MSIAILCFLGLLVTVQGLLPDPRVLDNYEKCWRYANCLAGGKGRQKITECFKKLKPEELKAAYEVVRNHAEFKSNNPYDSLTEYCAMSNITKPETYAKFVDGFESYAEKHCADGSEEGECNRLLDNLECYLGHLNQYEKQGKCQKDA